MGAACSLSTGALAHQPITPLCTPEDLTSSIKSPHRRDPVGSHRASLLGSGRARRRDSLPTPARSRITGSVLPRALALVPHLVNQSSISIRDTQRQGAGWRGSAIDSRCVRVCNIAVGRPAVSPRAANSHTPHPKSGVRGLPQRCAGGCAALTARGRDVLSQLSIIDLELFSASRVASSVAYWPPEPISPTAALSCKQSPRQRSASRSSPRRAPCGETRRVRLRRYHNEGETSLAPDSGIIRPASAVDDGGGLGALVIGSTASHITGTRAQRRRRCGQPSGNAYESVSTSLGRRRLQSPSRAPCQSRAAPPPLSREYRGASPAALTPRPDGWVPAPSIPRQRPVRTRSHVSGEDAGAGLLATAAFSRARPLPFPHVVQPRTMQRSAPTPVGAAAQQVLVAVAGLARSLSTSLAAGLPVEGGSRQGRHRARAPPPKARRTSPASTALESRAVLAALTLLREHIIGLLHPRPRQRRVHRPRRAPSSRGRGPGVFSAASASPSSLPFSPPTLCVVPRTTSPTPTLAKIASSAARSKPPRRRPPCRHSSSRPAQDTSRAVSAPCRCRSSRSRPALCLVLLALGEQVSFIGNVSPPASPSLRSPLDVVPAGGCEDRKLHARSLASGVRKPSPRRRGRLQGFPRAMCAHWRQRQRSRRSRARHTVVASKVLAAADILQRRASACLPPRSSSSTSTESTVASSTLRSSRRTSTKCSPRRTSSAARPPPAESSTSTAANIARSPPRSTAFPPPQAYRVLLTAAVLRTARALVSGAVNTSHRSAQDRRYMSFCSHLGSRVCSIDYSALSARGESGWEAYTVERNGLDRRLCTLDVLLRETDTL